jgi:hypothetical protein
MKIKILDTYNLIDIDSVYTEIYLPSKEMVNKTYSNIYNLVTLLLALFYCFLEMIISSYEK